MKKFIILIATMLLSVNSFAQGQIIKVDRCIIRYRDVTNIWGKVVERKISSQTMCLSNGDILTYSLQWGVWENEDKSPTQANFVVGKNYPAGTLVYKSGNNYEVINLQKTGTLIIKKVATHQVSSDFNASLKGDFSYHSFIVGNGSGSIRGSASGGTRTIVNVFFDNGTSATIEASKDPIWLDAEAGMKVEHHVYKDMNIYKLL